MATPIMQYIGARYVPLFYGDWVANTTYEPLTIVSYQGDTYTSKKIVPPSVGIPSENSEYWALTGAFNSQVEALRIQVEHLSEQVASSETDIDNLKEAQIQFNYSSSWNSLDIMCNILESILSIKQRGTTLEIINNSDIDIHYAENKLFINTEV